MAPKKAKTPKVTEMEEIFEKSQLSRQLHQQCVDEMTELYHKMTFGDFVKDFLTLLQLPLHVFEKSKAVDVCLEFVAKFAQSLPRDEVEEAAAGSSEPGGPGEGELNKMATILFRFITSAMGCQTKAVRLRSCQLMSKMFEFMADDAQIDDQTYELLVPATLERAKDKVPRVRYHAVNALTRLQDPKESDCPIITAFMFLMTYDPSPEVRQAAFSQIALSKTTLGLVLDRCRDVNEANRKSAFSLVAEKLSLKVLNLTQRTVLIESGLTDQSSAVRAIVEKRLIPSWLKNCDGKVTDLLYRMDLSAKVSAGEKVLAALFKHKDVEDLVKDFDLLTPSHVIDELTCENVFYWKSLITHVRKINGDDAEKAAETDELLDQLLPPLFEFVDYFNSYIKAQPSVAGECASEDYLSRTFISKQLLEIVQMMDMSDGAGRKHLLDTVKNLLADPTTAHYLIEPLIIIMCDLQKAHIIDATCWVAETISDILQPMSVGSGDPSQQVNETLSQHPNQNDPETLTKCLNIVSALLTHEGIKTLTPSLRSMLDSLILPSIQSKEPKVRNLAFKALGLCALIDQTVATKNIILFMQTLGVDVDQVKMTSLKSIFDLLLVYGLKLVEHIGYEIEDEGTRANPAAEIISVLLELLDGKDAEFHALVAEGLAKLILHQVLYAPKILSRLILLWFNPLSKDNPKLRHCIGCFLPLYAFDARANQESLEEAFLPTMRTLFKAPVHNPLTKVDLNSVTSFMVELTSRRHLTENAAGKEEPGAHGGLAIKICNELLIDEDTDGLELRTLARTLTLLDYDSMDKSLLKDLNRLLDRCLEEIRDRQAAKCLAKAKEMLEPLLPEEESVEEEEDPADESIVPPLTSQQSATATEALFSVRSQSQGGSSDTTISMAPPSKTTSIFGLPKKQRTLLKSSDTTMLSSPTPQPSKSLKSFVALSARSSGDFQGQKSPIPMRPSSSTGDISTSSNILETESAAPINPTLSVESMSDSESEVFVQSQSSSQEERTE